jgi:hypothetical protein
MGDRAGFAWKEPPVHNRIDELVAAGAIYRADDGTHERDDIARVRLAHALVSGGIGVEDLMHEIRGGRMPYAEIPRFGITPAATGRTYAEFAASLGDERAAQLPALYAAFGLSAGAAARDGDARGRGGRAHRVRGRVGHGR